MLWFYLPFWTAVVALGGGLFVVILITAVVIFAADIITRIRE